MNMMSKLTFFFEFQIKQIDEGISINQSNYIKVSLKKFEIENIKGIGTSMSPVYKFDKDENGKSIDPKLYKGRIGSLPYLTASIIFSIYMGARFQSNLMETYLI